MVAAVAFLLWALSSPASALAQAQSRRAVELETRLFVPCCYVQTLDVHESDLADKLRGEITRRLSEGEAPQAIEDDMVARYGERVRAVPRDVDPRANIPVAVFAALTLGLLALAWVALRWQRRQSQERIGTQNAVLDAKYDRELDAALRRADS